MDPIRYLLVTDKTSYQILLPDLKPRQDMRMVGWVSSGERALLLSVALKPQVIVLDLDLLPTHALQLIRYLRKHSETKYIRILSLVSDQCQGVALQAQDESDCYLTKPFEPEQLMMQIHTLGMTSTCTPFEYLITAVLLQLGMPSHLLGYQYIRTALITLEQKPDLLYRMMNGLYPVIAKKHNTCSSNVERSIRSAIAQTWLRGGAEPYHKLLGISGDYLPDKPTNSEFLSYMTECIHLQWERCQATGTSWYDLF